MHRPSFVLRAAANAGVLTALGTGLLMAATSPVASAATLGGTATVASPGTTTALNSGGSATAFTVSLPAQAACSGDTATDNYLVYGFLVPAPSSGQTLTAELQAIPNWATGDGTGYYPLVSTSDGQWEKINTAPTTGEIISIPNDFTFENLNKLLVNASLAPLVSSTPGSTANYDIGIACANASNVLSDYWSEPVTVSQSSSDSNGFVWATGAPSGGQLPEAPMAIALPLAGLAALGGAVLFRRRRQARLAVVAAGFGEIN
jgi:hypothetical protein